MFGKKIKRVISCAVLGFCMMSTTVFAGTWKLEIPGFEDYWMYIKDDGSRAKNEWIYDNGSWYFIMSSGNMARDIVTSTYEKTGGGNYCFESSGKLATGGFVDSYSYDGKRKLNDMYFADKDGHPLRGLFMVDGVLYKACYDNYIISNNWTSDCSLVVYDKSIRESIRGIECKYDNGKISDENGKPFTADSELYSKIDYLPKYDSKGNLIGAIQNPNGYIIK